MKKLLFLSFFGLFLLACTTDEGDGAPFVTDVVMPPSSQLFAPGDEVTVAARGFEADDDIMLRIAWPLSQAALPEGYADGVWAVVTERTESDITFLAPGGYPASTTEVKLFRRGKAMTLGKISVSDGRPPEEPSLYGITQYDCDETGIDRIDLTTGTLSDFAAFLRHEAGRLVLMELNMTRTNVAPVPPSWMLPSDIAPEMLGENPFVTVYGGYLLLAAHTAPDSYTPLVLTGRSGEGYAVKTGDAEQADAMVPFGVLDKGQDGETYYAVGGYAVAKGGVTELRLYNPVSMEFDRTLAAVQGTVRSIAVRHDGGKTEELFMLCDTGDGGNRIRVYDMESGSERVLDGAVPCSEIVLAR